MLNSKTVLVLGAGASHEIGFPLGERLKEIISSKLDMKFSGFQQVNGCPKISDAIRLYIKENSLDQSEFSGYITSAIDLKGALEVSQSIDHALYSRSNNRKIELCGKLGIVSSIIDYEQRSDLYYEHENYNIIDLTKLSKSWYPKFFFELSSNIDHENYKKIFDKLTIVNFNYDRSFEQYLYLSMIKRFGISGEESSEVIKNLNIIYPYGNIGKLPWQHYKKGEIIKYGDISYNQYNNIYKNIKTFHEIQSYDSNLKNSLRNASNIAFLGFGFHEQNMKLLDMEYVTNISNIYATGLNLSYNRVDDYKNRLNIAFKSNRVKIEIQDINCSSFFEYFNITV
ncbi:hypothetical protein PN473_00685 [Dolichospermum circinale CS-545/17]|nr:hypothetical protein [Dolichospermum circinale CS-545/17]